MKKLTISQLKKLSAGMDAAIRLRQITYGQTGTVLRVMLSLGSKDALKTSVITETIRVTQDRAIAQPNVTASIKKLVFAGYVSEAHGGGYVLNESAILELANVLEQIKMLEKLRPDA